VNRLHRSFHFPKSANISQAPTPKLKKLTIKTKKVNNFFSDFISPERRVKDSKVNQSQKIELLPFGYKKRDSHGTPIHFGKLKVDYKKPPVYNIISSLSAAESCDNNPDKKMATVYNEEVNIVTKFAFATRVGHMPNNPFKVNQDAFILAPNILNLQSMHFFGVCDGHGQYGKEVSSIIKQKLPASLEEYLYNSKLDVSKSLTQSFIDCNKELFENK